MGLPILILIGTCIISIFMWYEAIFYFFTHDISWVSQHTSWLLKRQFGNMDMMIIRTDSLIIDEELGTDTDNPLFLATTLLIIILQKRTIILILMSSPIFIISIFMCHNKLFIMNTHDISWVSQHTSWLLKHLLNVSVTYNHVSMIAYFTMEMNT
ncbi:hypothetical protein ACJX0J_024692, partial [Zea mays]